MDGQTHVPGVGQARSAAVDADPNTALEVIGPHPDMVQAYCDLLEHKWLLSEEAHRDVGLEFALDSYLSLGAPAPERAGETEAPAAVRSR